MSLMRPFSSMTDRFLNELQPWEEELLSPFWSRKAGRTLASTWLPAVDVIEEENDIKVIASLPGFKPNEIELEVDNNGLTITGQTSREETEGERHKNYYRREINRVSFSRQIPLPTEVKSEKATARYENGLLVVSVPKTGESKRHKVQIGK